MSEHAVARRTDPSTSWEAARSIDETTLRQSQAVVLATILVNGPMSDEELVGRVNHVLSPSGARTRRAELVTKNLIEDTGRRATLVSQRKAIIWGVKDPLTAAKALMEARR